MKDVRIEHKIEAVRQRIAGLHRRETEDPVWLKEIAPLALEELKTTLEDLEVTEESLRESEERFRLKVECVRDYAIFMLDPEGRVVSWNAGAERISGYQAEEIIGKSFSRFYTLEDIAVGKPESALALAQISSRYEEEGVRVRKDGEEFWASVVITAMCDEGGNLRGYTKVTRDITERRMAEEALRRSYDELERRIQERTAELAEANRTLRAEVAERKRAEEELLRLASIVESSDDAIIGETAEGVIVSWNRGAEKLYGYSAEEVKGCHVSILAPLDRLDEMPTIMERLKQGRKIESFETVRLRKDGRRIDVSTTVSPIEDPTGKMVGASVIARDITVHKQLEQQLLQARKMEAVGTLAGGVAHGLNNLLQSIIGYADLALLEADDGNRREWIARVVDSGRRGANLVAQLLAFSRRTIIDRQPLQLLTLAKEAVRSIKKTAGTTIRLKASGEIAVVNADPAQMRQMITNLVVNAMHAMPDGGKLTLTLENVTLDEAHGCQDADAKPGDYVCLSVRDTGVGMTPEVRERIFEPFFTTRASEMATGLGLAMVYGIVRMHEGYITVYSKPGEGSEFRAYLPAMDRETTPVPAVPPRPPARGTETILLVEDEDGVLNIGRAMLESLGYRVLTATNGKDALRVYRVHQKEIAAVLTDMVMPQMGGQMLCRVLKQTNPEVKVLLMSGYSMNQDVIRLLADDVKAFLQKPFDLNGLGQAVREALDG